MFFLIFNIITVISLLILFFILFFRGGYINKILALIMINPGINFLNNIVVLSGNIEQHSYILFVCFLTATMYGPLVYWYCRLLMGKKIVWYFPIHFLTFGLVLLNIYFWYQFEQLGAMDKHTYLKGLTSSEYPWQLGLANNIFTYLQLAYLIVALIEVYRFKSKSKNFFANTEKIRLQYLVTFITLLVGLTLFLGVLYAVLPMRDVEFFYIPFIIQITYLFVVVFAFQKNAVFSFSEYKDLQCNLDSLQQYQAFAEPLCRELKEMKKSNRFKLYGAEIENVYPIVKEKLAKGEVYRDSNLSLSSLAQQTGICAHTLSAVIKHKFQTNFFDLINSHRLEYVLKRLQTFDSTKQTIETLAYEAGFNSKSAFYRAFKKTMNVTPKQYLIDHSKN